MAFYRKLTEGWRLTDGILPESLLEQPMGVYEALREAGRLPDAEKGLNAMVCEWIAAREWVYSLRFDAPGEDDERIYVELPKAAGAGSAFLNGGPLGAFESGAVRLELTGALTAEHDNLLEIRFAPISYTRPVNKRPVPEIGLLCAPVLRAVNFAAIERMAVSSRMEGDTGVISISMTLTAHTAGKYTFRYSLSLDDEPAGKYEVTEKLPAARRMIRHEIRVAGAVRMNLERLDETVYGVKFELERGGVGCDVRHMETAFRPDAPMKCAAVLEWPVSGDTIDRLIDMGADGIVLSGMPGNAFEKNDFLNGLTVVPDGERVDSVGAMRAADMKKMADGESVWPADSAVWRLRGGCIPKKTGGMDAEKYTKVMRMRQAGEVLVRTQTLRKGKKRVTAQWDEEFAYLSSDALIEKSGAERPALAALKFGWQEAHAFCELPEGGCVKPDRLLQMNAWALVEQLRGSVLKVSVRVTDVKGAELYAETFPVMGGDARMAGVVSLRTPEEEGILIVRCELHEAKGGLISRTDSLIAVCGDDPLRLMGGVKKTELIVRCGKTRNEGDTAALSAGICLMPGEETDRAGAEWING